MGRALRQHANSSRNADRVPLHATISIRTLDGKPAAPLARCTNIGLGGLRVAAAEGLPPGTQVEIELKLPRGRIFVSRGHVAWSKQTLHLPLFGSPRGNDDDAIFGIVFESVSPDALLPIAHLFAARDRERARAGRIRRLRGYPIHG